MSTVDMPFSFSSFNGVSDLLHPNSSIRERFISRIQGRSKSKNDGKKARHERNALYQSKLADLNLRGQVGEEKHKLIESNPNLVGLPRFYGIKLAGADALRHGSARPHDDAWVSEGHTMFFSSFGVPGKPVKFNDGWIHGGDINVSSDCHIYSINTTDANGRKLGFYLDFADPLAPIGSLTTPYGIYHLALQPFAVQFDVSISLNTGAYYSTDTSKFIWDATSDAWKNAQWIPKSMVFSYDTVTKPNPFGKPVLVNEVSFKDSEDPSHPFELTKDDYPLKYSAIVDGKIEDDAVYMSVTVAADGDVPPPTPSRSTQAVKSVYPNLSTFKFDEFGDSFTGAYKVPDSDTVYAVTGVGIIGYVAGVPDSIERPPVALAARNMPMAVSQPEGCAGENLATVLGTFNGAVASDVPRSKPSFSTNIKPAKTGFHPSALEASDSNLIVNGLLGLDPMMPSPEGSTSKFYDAVSDIANQDFNDIICYYMDEDIRTTFVRAGPYNISDPGVLRIANDSNMNAEFYKTLQVPYVTASLSGATNIKEAPYCNGLRAQKQLQDQPANSPIYKRHSDALYRNRYLQRFPIIQDYLNDQSETDYTAIMQSAAATMKQELTSRAQGISDPKALADALADIDALLKWATDNKLYWAFNLYYYCEHFFIPTLYAQSVNGRYSNNISIKLKTLSSTFGMLEGSETNPDGKTFQQAFNDLLRVFQMTSIIPQLVDLDGFAGDFDSILKAMLQQFYNDNISNPDPKIAEQAALAKALLEDDKARQGFYNNIISAMRLASALSSWSYIVKVFGNFNEAATWYKGLVNAGEMASSFMMFACGIMLIMCTLGPTWSTMTAEQRVNFVTTAVLVVLVFAIKIAQGVLRLLYFWNDLSGFFDCFKAFIGFESVFKALPSAASKTSNSLARWLIRTEEEAAGMEVEDLTIWTKMFGRNAGEFLTNCVGAVLAGVCLVLSALDIANTNDPLQKAMDAMMIISSSLQLLAIAAGWVVSAGLITAEATVAIIGTVASWLGPAALLFAAAGLIIMIVWMCLDRDPPNPIRDFINQRAEPAGLMMPFKTEIDYLNAIPADANSISLNGIDFGAKYDPGSATAAYMQLGVGSGQPMTWKLGTSAAVTYLPDTCWSVKTDATGITRVFTYITNDKKLLQTIYLAILDDGTVGFAPPPAKVTTDSSGKITPVDPQVYDAQLKKQQWSIVCRAEGTSITRTVNKKPQTFMQSAYFSVFNGNNQLYLEPNGAGGFQYALGAPTFGSLPWWNLTLDAIGPPPLSYSKNPWTLSTVSTDETNVPMFDGPTSLPLTWSITPALPSWLQLVGSGDKQGMVMQTAGVKAPATAAQQYTVTASMVIAGKTLSQSTAFTVSVTAPPAPVPPK
ncbi:hypothetical protein Dda_1885 [Drechslerella dactyloides]|uniref:Uncharacterized protein n=1 Tax=Drechslerella dactyloides TaxID=74499 RepID=A0AAD6J6T1_DREDA|nr:hypothetical protein Dda_1885 [Drechslerella dactyloides]